MDHGLIAAAERAAQRCGGGLTPIRRRVFEIIAEAGRPIGAYAILGEMNRATGRAMPPTVYRALEFLLDLQVIHRLESLNAYLACPDSANPHEAQFLICDGCGVTEEIVDDGVVRSIDREGRAHGFQVTRPVVELHGRCPTCRADRP